MGTVAALEVLLDQRRVWRGQSVAPAAGAQPTGHAQLDRRLPSGGWPRAALTEILMPAAGTGELRLLWPTIARLTAAGQRVVLVAPPFIPYPAAWLAAGVALQHLVIIQATGKEVLWAAEQCLRSGCCAAVLCWPQRADDRGMRRLQVAAESGDSLGFALRDAGEAVNPSPAALRLVLDTPPGSVRLLKCRGGVVPQTSFALAEGA
ncbi:DNA lesion error-prone repair protein ImuA [Stutzerimonas stutzeri]|uniref:DNA lesion error-prone repair protein ImuA n=1 Tax=Stutzerimonas stutzeri TaxID=316 RepID=A0A2S4ATL4_STUST|nr:translesion DNA synthesis-associated protein ImuA [Stutzerimonas stutzeri]MCQ4261479.1 translesion DNA synthesis-associated protein ImuA [Stutzerimonas stutzeri]POH84783.1 DNA lesion error-prone repair protein ImuA [Stutzerimonas stutzeri]